MNQEPSKLLTEELKNYYVLAKNFTDQTEILLAHIKLNELSDEEVVEQLFLIFEALKKLKDAILHTGAVQ